MTQSLLLGLVSLAIAAGLLFAGLPNKQGETPHFLQFHAAPIYPAIVLVFIALGLAELISWAIS